MPCMALKPYFNPFISADVAYDSDRSMEVSSRCRWKKSYSYANLRRRLMALDSSSINSIVEVSSDF